MLRKPRMLRLACVWTQLMKKLTLTAAFAQFGATLKNPRWACSALAQDGSLVISCWSEFLKSQPNGGQRYEYSLSSQWGEGNRLGRELLIRHLHTAFNHALPVRLVVATLDKREDRKVITTDASPFPKTFSTSPQLVGRVVAFDNESFAIEFKVP